MAESGMVRASLHLDLPEMTVLIDKRHAAERDECLAADMNDCLSRPVRAGRLSAPRRPRLMRR